MARWATFLDRDGTLIEEVGHLGRPEDIKVIPGAPQAVKRLSDAGAIVVIATNQPVIARGLIDEPALGRIHEHLKTLFSAEGAKFDAIYYCPHHPEKHHAEGEPRYRVECDCRKPKTGMLLQAAKQFDIDLTRSFMVGDTTRDILTARNAGCRGVLVQTGYGGKDALFNVRPEVTCADVEAAAGWIVGQADSR